MFRIHAIGVSASALPRHDLVAVVVYWSNEVVAKGTVPWKTTPDLLLLASAAGLADFLVLPGSNNFP